MFFLMSWLFWGVEGIFTFSMEPSCLLSSNEYLFGAAGALEQDVGVAGVAGVGVSVVGQVVEEAVEDADVLGAHPREVRVRRRGAALQHAAAIRH